MNQGCSSGSAQLEESLYKMLLENAAEAIEALDRNGVILYATPSILHWLGHRADDLAGTSSEDLVHPEDRSLWNEALSRAKDTPGVAAAPVALRMRHMDGSWRLMERVVKALAKPCGTIEFVVRSRCIAEPDETCEAAKESEALFRSLAECPMTGICIVQDGVFKYANTAFAEAYGYSAKELVDRSWRDLVFPEDIPAVAENMKRLGSGETNAVRLEFRGVRRDGEIIQVELFGNRTFYKGQAAVIGTFFDIIQGRPTAIGTQLDITERKRLETALLESENRFRILAEKSPVGIYMIQDGVFKYGNPKFLEMNGYEESELIGMPWRNLAYYKDHPLIEENLRKRETGEENTSNYEFRHCRKDGTLFNVEVFGGVTRHGGKTALIGTAVDISDRKRTERELALRAEELARSNADLEQFAYIASHDLQEPLRMVASFTELLARRYKGRLDSDADEFISFAVSGANRMKALINDLLAYSRVGTKARAFAPTDCQVALDSAVRNLAVAIMEHQARVRTSSPLPVVMADEVQLTQAFQNLIANAIKFHGAEPPLIEITAVEQEYEWIFSVKDNGIGIEPHHFDRIFAVFQRIHSQQDYPGTGIGLAICKKIVERHGGRIWVESEPGRGSCFQFTLPIRKDVAQ